MPPSKAPAAPPLAEKALSHAAAIAAPLGIGLRLVRVTPSKEGYHRVLEYQYQVGPGPTIAKVFTGPYEEFSKAANAGAMVYLHHVGDRLRHDGLDDVEQVLLHGRPAEAIVDSAHADSNRLVVMTTHGRSGFGRWVMGSVTDRVVRGSGDPVLVVRVVPELAAVAAD